MHSFIYKTISKHSKRTYTMYKGRQKTFCVNACHVKSFLTTRTFGMHHGHIK